MAFRPMVDIADAPPELRCSIQEFFPESAQQEAANVAYLESRWNAFAVADTTSANTPCGAVIENRGGVSITAERSIGYFQINVCNFPDWDAVRLYNARENAGTAHMLYDQAGAKWTPWRFSAEALGLL